MYKNKAAIIRLKQSNLDIDQFKFTPTPYYLPNFMNIFDWSIPFVSEKILEIYTEIYSHLQKIEDEEIQSEKFIKAMEEIQEDEELKYKVKFLNKKRLQ